MSGKPVGHLPHVERPWLYHPPAETLVVVLEDRKGGVLKRPANICFGGKREKRPLSAASTDGTSPSSRFPTRGQDSFIKLEKGSNLMAMHPSSSAPKDVSTFFNPGSIAIIGASANLGKLGGRPVAALLRKGYAGTIYPINPRYEKVGGLPCYPSIADVPDDVDLAIIAVPIGETLDALEQCARKKVRAAVVFTAGFAEVGAEGRALQQAISDLARRSGMRILGPNCLGLVSFHNGVMASFTDIAELDIGPAGSLGFVTQSGAYGEKTVLQAVQDGVGFSCFISVGNEADLQMADFLYYLSGDGQTRLMGAYLEGPEDGLSEGAGTRR
jgi:acetyltransferase